MMIISSPGLKAEVEETICTAYHSDHWFYEIHNPLMFIDTARRCNENLKHGFVYMNLHQMEVFVFLLVLFKCKFNMFFKACIYIYEISHDGF